MRTAELRDQGRGGGLAEHVRDLWACRTGPNELRRELRVRVRDALQLNGELLVTEDVYAALPPHERDARIRWLDEQRCVTVVLLAPAPPVGRLEQI